MFIAVENVKAMEGGTMLCTSIFVVEMLPLSVVVFVKYITGNTFGSSRLNFATNLSKMLITV